MNIKKGWIASLLLLVILLSSCGLAGKTSIPPEMSHVALSTFENNTGETDLERRLTDEVYDQLIAHGELRLVAPEQADVKIKGEINEYLKIPLAFGERDVVEQYKLRVEIALELIDVETGEMIRGFENIFRETTFSEVIPPRETEYQAQDRIIRQLGRDVLTSTVEGWPYISG